MADRMEEIGVRPDLQERRQEDIWELPNDCADFTHKQGIPASFTEKDCIQF